MRMVKVVLLCCFVFALVMGCSSENKQAMEKTETPQTTAQPTKTTPTTTATAEVEEVTLAVTGMT